MDSLAFSRMNKWLTLFFANSFCIHYRLRELTIFKICFVNLLHIHYIFREFTYDLLSVPRIDFQCTIYFANKLSNHYIYREFTSNELSFSRIHFDFTFFLNLHLVHYLSYIAYSLALLILEFPFNSFAIFAN